MTDQFPRVSKERISSIKDRAQKYPDYALNGATVLDLLADRADMEAANAKLADQNGKANGALIGMVAALSDAKAEIERLTKTVVWGCYEEEFPLFAQGPNQCELASEVTADECKSYVEKIKDLRAQLAAANARPTQAAQDVFCPNCPPIGYPTDETRCDPCPRRMAHGNGAAPAKEPTK